MQSKFLTLNREDAVKIFKAMGYAMASALVTALIAFFALPDIELPAWLVPVMPIVNGLLYGLKKLLEGKA